MTDNRDIRGGGVPVLLPGGWVGPSASVHTLWVSLWLSACLPFGAHTGQRKIPLLALAAPRPSGPSSGDPGPLPPWPVRPR